MPFGGGVKPTRRVPGIDDPPSPGWGYEYCVAQARCESAILQLDPIVQGSEEI